MSGSDLALVQNDNPSAALEPSRTVAFLTLAINEFYMRNDGSDKRARRPLTRFPRQSREKPRKTDRM
jgi:hypothetical protein